MATAQEIRIEILTQLYAQRPGSRSVPELLRLAKRDQVYLFSGTTEFEIRRECEYLAGLPAPQVEKLTGLDRWQITSSGVQFMEENGLV